MQGSGTTRDAIIIGSGFGGAIVAHTLVNAGHRVLMLERGSWVRRGPRNWDPEGTMEVSPYYSYESAYREQRALRDKPTGAVWAVGGQSIFYGAVSLRFRESDFRPDPEIVGDSGARWPYEYADLEPYYTRAERILGVAGESGADPTEPPRSADYPLELNGISPVSRMIGDAARELGLRPFRLPLAINYASANGRSTCVACGTCDTFACGIGAKNDVAVAVLPQLIARGLELRADTVVTGLLESGGRVEAVECRDRHSGRRYRETARLFVLSAGALGSPHLLLASGLERLNPGGHTVGRYLMRHCSAIPFGYFRRLPEDGMEFQKQLGIHDFYFGHPTAGSTSGPLGGIQQLQTPPVRLVKEYLPRPLSTLMARMVPNTTGLLAMAQDQPRYANHVALDPSRRGDFGLPRLVIRHRHSARDRRARRALVRVAKRVLRRAGAVFCYVHKIRTFSHASGTVRMGVHPRESALDPFCRFRGVPNLFVVDASVFPSSAAVNPSLTIAANALRASEEIERVLTKDDVMATHG